MPEKKTSPTVSDSITKETLLKVSKEVVIKFIEMGRVTPATFDDTFKKIYSTLKNTTDKH